MRDSFAGLALVFALVLAAGCSSRAPLDVPVLENFEDAYEWAQSLAGTPLFIEWRDLGDGTLELVCTDRWKWSSDYSRGVVLRPLFVAWAKTDETARPVLVRVVDRRGTLIDSMWGVPTLREEQKH